MPDTTRPKSVRKPKSHKSDGSKKQRWTAAQRADQGRPPRRSAGRGAELEQRPARSTRPAGRSEFRTDTRPERTDRRFEDRGERRPERTERRFEDRPARRFEDRPARQFEDRGERRPERTERRFEDRPARRFDDRPARRFEDRGERRFEDRGDRRPERTERRFDERPERRERTFDRSSDSRPERRFERPTRVDHHGDRFERRPARSSRPVESVHEDSDQMSWEAAEAPTATAAVQSDNGFAALGVPRTLVQALAASGITAPFPIQSATIPDALAGRDVLGRGRTGSGKTLGFGLPMLTRLAGSTASSGTARAIVLVPTRELALQVADVIAPLARTVDLSVALICGGMAYGPQLKAFGRGVDIVVATPGRLIDLLDQGAADLSRVEITVLDEADHMADLGFLPAVTQVLDTVPGGGQRLLFSATLDSGVDRLVRRYLSDPVTHETDPDRASVSTMAHHVLLIKPYDKVTVTAELAGRDGRTVAFVRTQRGADRVAEQLRETGVMAGALHGGLTQGARARILAAFKDGKLPVLVATDVAARGIHVDDVGLVLQIDPPAGPKDYLHRAGRTARAGEAGTVVTLTLPHQRREVKRLTEQAGVRVVPAEVAPSDEQLVAIGAVAVATSDPIAQSAYEAVIAPPKREANRRPRGNRPQGGYRKGPRNR